MKMLAEDIRNGSFKTSYLLFGEEAYLRNQYKNRLKNALSDPSDTMNFSRFEGKGILPAEIISLADTLPFFAERRLILIEDSGFFKNKCDELADYLPTMPDTTCLLFVETEVDKRNRLYKAVQKYGRVTEFQVQDERTLMKWILSTLKKENRQITETTLRTFLEHTGTDMENISMELDKLLSYTLGRDVITSEDVNAICTMQTTGQIFEMIRAIAEKNQKKALELYYDLLALKEPPMRILFLIARQFNQLLLVKSLAAKGLDKNAIASRAQIAPFVAGRCMAQARSFTLTQLEAAVRDCVESEEAVKTGAVSDILSVELLIVKYSQKLPQ
ncbi:DNA polymerase III subunit delta [Anaerosacchariphilus sp. NSJ-68]|uniref:DNA polymerase III subunit delta n=2 Tax=Lachnospiraceae TaxID=186803 RepID=A0A923RNR4_9FIRM|nr:MULTISPECIES: DNA polymerase III subunit delta [Lachnospiraceae]MBC5659650.1 DNA polymerase III subunit delta [Anaerosacchariphilus hominis]MBC5697317.1 DNA polymerase III subunit delta [Roseburia difficilis]